jgi:hypothetical protein
MGNLSSIFGGSAAKPSLNIDDSVVRKALHELFFEVGQEEEKISTTPAAKMTPKLSEATLWIDGEVSNRVRDCWCNDVWQSPARRDDP